MAQLITVRLNKADQQPLGFRLQGGKDFGTPLVVQKVNGGSAAERAGLQAGDALIRVNTTDVYLLRHQEAQDAIRAAGGNLELTVQRGGGTWRPSVTPTGSLPRPGSRSIGSTPTLVTNTSLKATPQPSRAFGSGHNNVAKPFGYMNGNDSVKSIVNKQYNTPVNMYSDKTIAETLSAQTEVLAGGVLGVNFKKNEKTYDAEKSAVFKVLQEEQNDPEPEPSHFYSRASVARAGTPCSLHRTHRSRSRTPRVLAGTPQPPPPVARASTGTQTPQEQLAPEPPHRPSIPMGCHEVLPDGRIALGAPALPQPRDALPVVNDTPYCSDCNRYIIGVFVRIKDKNLHVECFKCSTCGTSLKNQGYYNLNGKLYCDIHAKLVARNNPPAPNLEPVTVPPGSRIPSNTYSTPLPPLATNNYTNGSSSLFSPSSNLSGPKPFGSSIGSAYSPSLSPRSAPMSPARPVTAPAPAPAPLVAPAPAPVPPPAAPFAPTNDLLTSSSPLKPEYKSPAEERLIRKMAKMALNGYEIGIQRKIKPADHIQSMADKIQDTVVTKHPLNSDSVPTVENNLTKTLERGYKTHDSIQSIGDKIKDTIKNNHPANESMSKPNILIPPPLPNSPIPTFNVHSTPIGHPLNNSDDKKKYNTIPKTLNASLVMDDRLIINSDKSNNGSGYSSSEDSLKDKSEHNFTGTLRKTGIDKSSFLNSMNGSNNNHGNHENKPELKFDSGYSNTLNKRKLFEKADNTFNSTNSLNKSSELINNVSDTNIWNKTNNSDHVSKSENNKNVSAHYDDDLAKKKELPNNLINNSLYTYKKSANNGHDQSNDCTDYVNADETKKFSGSEMKQEKQNTDEEIVVRRRQKKTSRDDDGRRDSHIIARPLSTITCADVAEGLYPVCHKCDKAITRGPFITALGRIWCPEHFICVNATCRRPLQDIGFVEENGQLYCEFCFEQYIAPACDKCHAKIKGDCLNAIGKHYHPECFNCVYCGKLFGNNPFFLEDGLPYCEADWNDLFTTKCFACGFPVEAGDRWVEALNNNYHSQCFNCTVCKKNLEGQSFFAKGGRPFCKTHAR
ncbi:PDZ and LIM domain protein Zasp isoform X4 [Trichoplusia ni]|uniref:PDZ and LIM domain protein Zasp isoform X4 n=1 Tax=Trichoplusia ni TaxID=7111 RepID=A0A7E5VNX1_TRINI|nr:PDZ and LIM domain protein Zasp isoform X4 [Trichoplusia ni]